jgi:hypothetical protein
MVSYTRLHLCGDKKCSFKEKNTKKKDVNIIRYNVNIILKDENY